jgi:hypothetical protein
MQSGTLTAAAVASAQEVNSAEIDQANLHLEQTRNGIIGALIGMSEAQWRFKPAPGVWSVAENMEHIIFVQERVLGLIHNQIATAPPSAADRNPGLVDAIIVNQFPNRLTRFPAPEALHPKGDYTLNEARDRMAANTRELAVCLESVPNLRGHVLESPPLKAVSKGEHTLMDGYQWILAVSAHTERHTKQILEVRADPDFPSN